MTADVFDADVVRLLDEAEEVRIETRSPSGAARSTIIWIVVAGGAPYVRSVRGGRGRWYRDLGLEPHGALLIAGRRIPFLAVPATDADAVEACSHALGKKYADQRASTLAMLQPETLPTTLRLDPA